MSGVAYHVPVLLGESIDGLKVSEGGVYVDVTFGGGGHSREILRRLGSKGHLYSFDQDADAVQNAADIDSEAFTFVRSNFRFLKNFLRYHGVSEVDGVLADLGVSSHHFDASERGFSFRGDGPLDMRMNRSARLTAADVLNSYDERRLADVFYLYGELKQARRLAAAVVKERGRNSLTQTSDLLRVAEPFFRGDREKKELAKLFQSLRIEVNQEMTALRDMLEQATEMLRKGGRLVVITYHSLEDRMVKNLMKTGNVEGREEKDFFGRMETPFRQVGKMTVPSPEEQERNPRSRSAKLRIAEKA